jgi:tetratricopeptide (TPR) repeat protein
MSDFNLAERFPEMRPVHKAPSLTTVNGIGTSLAGRRDYDEETNTYVTTLCFCFLFIPIIPLRAYRVAEAGGGRYYFLGRVPLSLFAWRWNFSLPIFLAIGLGALGRHLYTESADYKARQKLEEADRLAARGEGGKAAHVLEEVMLGGSGRAPDARKKLDGLVATPPESLSEAAEVFQVALDLHRRGHRQEPNLFDWALDLAQKNADIDPKGALAILEVVAPLDPRPADRITLHRKLLERAVAQEPDDPAFASRLSVVCEAMGDRKRCEAVLKRHEGRLGSLDGAAVLGRIYAGEGKFDQAEKLLTRYLDERLPLLQSAQQRFLSLFQTGRQRIIDSLNQGNAPGFNYAKFKSAGQAEQGNMVEEYIDARLRSDPAWYTTLTERAAQAPVVTAAIELGIVRLQRAQALADPAARRKELERAEQAFLKVQSEGGQKDDYRLNLGQVYYWLGKHGEGKKLFDELLKSHNRSAELLLNVAHRLRAVGDWSGARALAEEAYKNAGEHAKKTAAAHLRSLLFTDLDDQLAWLEKSDSNNSEIKASLANGRANKAQLDGKDDEAIRLFREALAIYASMPESPGSLNNGALVHFELYELTHDREEFLRGTDKLNRAISLLPSNTILLYNGAIRMMTAAAQDLLGEAIDLKALKRPASISLVDYLYEDEPGKERFVARLIKHPGYHKAVAYSEKLMLLSPRQPNSYTFLEWLYSWTHDVKGLQSVWKKLQTVEVDREQTDREMLDNMAGKKDDKIRAEWKKGLARQQMVWEEARKNKGVNFAVAANTLASVQMGGAVLGEPVDADHTVKLAEEADAAAPSLSTKNALIQALTFRAHRALVKAEPAYAEMARKTARSLDTALLGYVLAHEGSLRDKAQANVDVKRVQTILRQQRRAFPGQTRASTWAFLRASHPDEAAAIAKELLANKHDAIKRQIDRALTPLSASVALGEHFRLLMAGKEAEASAVLAEAAKRGVPMPVEAK